MALFAAFTSINTGTGAPGSTVVISGLSFAPKVAFLFWSGNTETTDTSGRGDMKRGFGVATSTSSRAYATTLTQDTPTTMVTNRMQGTAACMGVTTTADAIDGLLDVQSFDSGGITFVVDDTFTASYRIHVLMLGGDSIVNAIVSSFTKADATGNQSITSLAFRPNFLLVFGDGQTTVSNAVSIDSTFNMGAADARGNQWAFTMGGNDAAGNTQSMSYGYNAEIIAQLAGGVNLTESRASFTQFTNTGFDINWLEVVAGAKIYPYVAIQFAQPDDVNVGNTTTAASLTTVPVTGKRFTPAGGLIMSACSPMSTQDTPIDDDQWSIGAFASASSRGAMFGTDDDAAATAVVSRGVSHDQVYVNLLATSGAVEGEMDVQSVDPSGVTFVMDDADNAANFFGYVLFGASEPLFRRQQNTLLRR